PRSVYRETGLSSARTRSIPQESLPCPIQSIGPAACATAIASKAPSPNRPRQIPGSAPPALHEHSPLAIRAFPFPPSPRNSVACWQRVHPARLRSLPSPLALLRPDPVTFPVQRWSPVVARKPFALISLRSNIRRSSLHLH